MGAALLATGFAAYTLLSGSSAFAMGAPQRSALRGGLAQRRVGPEDTLVMEKPVAEEVTEAESKVAAEAYEVWKDQFPMVAVRRSFFSGFDLERNEVLVPCARDDIEPRFLLLARSLGLSPEETLEIFRDDIFILNEMDQKIPVKVEALRSIAESEEEMLDLLRTSPKAFGMTTAEEIKDRGIADMRFRSALDAFFCFLGTPVRLAGDFFRRKQAAEMGVDEDDGKGAANVEGVAAVDKELGETRRNIGIFFFGSWISALLYVSYLDTTYGGPIHGKGICAASPIPTFNIPDAEGYSRLPFNCAPIYKWYLEPQMTEEQKKAMQGLQVKVESKNCGRLMGGQKRECDQNTVGGRVWTAEELEKDPSFWDKKP